MSHLSYGPSMASRVRYSCRSHKKDHSIYGEISESLGIRIKDVMEMQYGLKGWFDLVADLFRLKLVIERSCLCRMISKPLMKRILNRQSLRLVAFWCSCTMRRNRVNGVRQDILNPTRSAYPYFFSLLLVQAEWQCAKENNIPIIVVVGCSFDLGRCSFCLT